LGETLPEIAFEKAGIIKPRVPVVVGESSAEIDEVFERKVLYTNLSDPMYMGNRSAIMSLLTFADKVEPGLWSEHEEILAEMDLRGDYQRKNLRTVLAALEVLGMECDRDAIVHTAERTGFRGRWDQVSENPRVICDIGHNEHGLKYNFAQLAKMRESGEMLDLVIVYGSVADKDVDAAVRLFPENAIYVFTNAQGKRALPSVEVLEKYQSFCKEAGREVGEVYCVSTVAEAKEKAYSIVRAISAEKSEASALIYVGGSTYVVSEFVSLI
jgi:dihydrofolate synthase/folylpolyglutamate synthase